MALSKMHLPKKGNFGQKSSRFLY